MLSTKQDPQENSLTFWFASTLSRHPLITSSMLSINSVYPSVSKARNQEAAIIFPVIHYLAARHCQKLRNQLVWSILTEDSTGPHDRPADGRRQSVSNEDGHPRPFPA